MKKYYINFADSIFKKEQIFSLKKAKSKGNFDFVCGYSPADIDTNFYSQNNNILNQKRGRGFWLWKPYFILKKLKEMQLGDYLFYSDAGVFFTKPIDILIEEIERSDQDIMGFELPLIESQWTKEELFNSMQCTEKTFRETNQIIGGFQLIKKTTFSLEFYNEYLEYACNEINLTDKYDNKILQNTDFIDHRHDQSIFSLLYKKNKLRPFKDPTQFGKYPVCYADIKIKNLTPNKLFIVKNNKPPRGINLFPSHPTKLKFRYFNYAENYQHVIHIHRRENPLWNYIKYKIKDNLGMY